jgi:hypothetical protein
MNPIMVGSGAFQDILMKDAMIVSLVEDRFALEAADENLPLPYILAVHMYGGEENLAPSRSIDMTFKVVAVDKAILSTANIANHIQRVVVGSFPDMADGWSPNIGITATTPVIEKKIIQQQEFWQIGSFYRLRAIKK